MKRRWHRFLYRVPFGWRYRWQRAWREKRERERAGAKPLGAEGYNRILKHAWGDPRFEVALNGPNPLHSFLAGEPYEPLDADWWEPRHDQPWRRPLLTQPKP